MFVPSPTWHAPLLALAVALAARLLGRATGAGRMRGMAAALGILAGWGWLGLPGLLPHLLSPGLLLGLGLPRLVLRAVLSPTGESGRLPGAALAILATAAVLPTAGKPGRAAPLLLGAALGWWLAGAPAHGDGLVRGMAVAAATAGGTLLVVRLLADGDAWRGTAAAFALAAAFLAAGAPAHWPATALVAAGALAALLPGEVPVAMLAPAAGLVAAAVAAELADGMAARQRPGALDLACLAPLAVLLLAPRLLPRLSRAGPALAGILAAAGCAALVWMVGRATGRH